jgi:hypothetical protein
MDLKVANEEKAEGEQAPQAAIKKRKTKLIDLPLSIKVPHLTKADINLYFENEVRNGFGYGLVNLVYKVLLFKRFRWL